MQLSSKLVLTCTKAFINLVFSAAKLITAMAELNQCSSPAMSNAMQLCPFLQSMAENTQKSFAHSFSEKFSFLPGAKGPIFEDGPNFEMAFKLFHGDHGIVPLSRSSNESFRPLDSFNHSSFVGSGFENIPISNPMSHALAASAATISLSAFGPSGPFRFDPLNSLRQQPPKKDAERKENDDSQSKKENSPENLSVHEAAGSEWLASGNCPIAKTYRALNSFIPLVATALKPTSGFKYRCPPAVVAARAALAQVPAVKALRPQELPIKVLAIGILGASLNIPLGVWREHCVKFSPQWILAVHASVPFIAMLRKAVLMPKYAMAFTIASSIIGQTIGSRLERNRLTRLKENEPVTVVPERDMRENSEGMAVQNDSYQGAVNKKCVDSEFHLQNDMGLKSNPVLVC